MRLAKRCVACDGERLKYAPAVLMPFVAERVFGWRPTEISPEPDMPAGMSYSICKTMMCEDCGMLFLDMRFDDEEMAALYRDYRGEAYTADRDRCEPGYAARNATMFAESNYIDQIDAILVPYLSAKPRVLDWGGDTSVNTPFRSRAMQHDVYDISNRPMVEGARSVDLDTVKASVYDLIVFSHVLEHVPYPRESLREIVNAMRPETVLYVEVPHEEVVRLSENPAQRLDRKRHWHEQINFFTPSALDAIFKEVGLSIVERKSLPITAGGEECHVFSIVARRFDVSQSTISLLRQD